MKDRIRPFLSIVIPCYNSGKYISKGLQSIVDCNMNDIEVIIADDCSTESYIDMVDQFRDKLNIIECCNEYNCGGPSNSRELGASLASGQYITFMDHDDYLDTKGIHMFRSYVEENGYPEYVCCGIRQVDSEGNIEIEKYNILPFLHSKFFNLDKFYRKCDLHHKKDIKYQEDNYFTALVACNLIKYNLEPKFTNFCTHCWYNNERSLGTSMKNRKSERDVNLEMFNTNISITYDIMLKFFDEGSLPYPVACEWLIREILQMYFDTQMYHQFFNDYLPSLSNMIKDIELRLELDNQGIFDLATSDNGRIFNSVAAEVLQFFPDEIKCYESFVEFLDICTNHS